uniref:Proline rich 35 n=1 Tax=Seriola lalandi dorsalis TaxID=1841481 RepID=A0A3B4XWX0_SERLL
MSKDDACKVTSASKHKERKPKKPHYIPRPWGKPYNYKCFQCPFTCMEKSHLYNHMKYSLCKNSLSLLIESDWPYKKGNILHPDQLRPFQQAHGLRAPGKDELEQMTRAEERQRQRRSPEEEGEDRESQGPEEEEEGGRGEGAEIAGVSSSIPCYPPPPNLVDYQDPTGLNLSVLGVGYPISPSLFSYMNSAHAQLAQLPFLASAAQLMHPASGAHTDRALIPPRLYYPFLCEHTFGAASTQSDSSKGLKTSTNSLEANPLSGFQPKVNLWKVPALRPGTTAVSPAGWVAGHSEGSETSSLSTCGGPNSQDSTAARTMGEGASESVAALLSDLSNALQEYQEAERKISHLEKEDLPAQRHLWEHLSKIRSELSHIHQALERTARQSDGPLDLSVKRDSTDLAAKSPSVGLPVPLLLNPGAPLQRSEPLGPSSTLVKRRTTCLPPGISTQRWAAPPPLAPSPPSHSRRSGKGQLPRPEEPPVDVQSEEVRMPV